MTSHDFPVLQLKRNEERRLMAGHQWVFSNEVDTDKTPLTAFRPGDVCRVMSARDKMLGVAYVNPHALICARIISRNNQFSSLQSLIVNRLQDALALRERCYAQPFYRLVYGESDQLPGLVLDRFGDVIVGQISTAGMEARKDDIVAAVKEVVNPGAMLWKNDSGARDLEGLPACVETAFGDVPDRIAISESNVTFHAPVREGQKTGWFFDQAINRKSLLKYVHGATVLDVFSYAGAWGLTAARAGASEVTCVDSSATALESIAQSAANNGLQVNTLKGDAFDVLAELHERGRKFDVVIIDPPAFIKRKKDIPKGEAAYQRLNRLAMQLVNRNGLLVSCSCSWHLHSAELVNAIQRAARQLNRFVQIIETGGQSPDHPVHPAIAETQYLKAFTVRVVGE
ncbi:MAG TPA: class I SAM-dependent rRNA methyltransferase [Steroidobacteraceae bacterium]|nr:class I SAM-dependent rRNA methyltransferase [Steroidobacteraceae bacterium]